MIQKIAQKIKDSTHIIITTGAGMGVDSGLPDFRGPNGFWNTYIPFRNKFQYYECANPQFMTEHPDLFWGFYGHRLELYRQTNPHQGFKILLDWCKNKKYFSVTSNVDGHFQKAGFAEDKVFEVHGSINHMQCNKCQIIFSAENYNIKFDQSTFSAESPLPNCQHCKSLIRPNILMFGDYQFISDRTDEQDSCYNDFLNDINREDKIVIIEIGAGTAVPTIRYTSERLFDKLRNVWFIRINPTEPEGPKLNEYNENKMFYSFKCGGLEALNQINQYFQQL